MSDFNSSLPIRTQSNGDAAVKVVDGTITSQQLAVNADGSVNITDNGASITVDATDLDIRDLVFATDKVDVSASVIALDAGTLAALESITVQNGAGAAAVNIQDGGNSITIDNANLVSIDGKIANDYGASSGAIRTASQIGNTTGAANFNAGATGAQTLRTSANITRNGTELSYGVGASDANTLRAASVIHDGTDTMAVNTDGSINVVVQEDVGTEVVNYNTSASLAAGGTSNHDLVFATASRLYQVWASASGKLKIEVQVETGSATGVFNTRAVGFNSTANPNIDLNLAKYAAIPLGARVRVIRTNTDNQAQDVYSTIVGILG